MQEQSKVFIIYDSILNSVFFSMVLNPLLRELKENPKLTVWLISFENKKLSDNDIIKQIPAHDRLHFVLATKLKFFGIISLKPAISQLKRILSDINPTTVVARGPLAGYIALKSTNTNIKIQARGLAAEEYRYIKKNFSFPKKILHNFIYKQLKLVEKTAYGNKNASIEAVSCALKTHLVEKFNSNPKKITIADNELSTKFNPAQKTFLKKKVREKLSIPDSATVYCYSGSSRAWQCTRETIKYFKQEYKDDNSRFLLILSNDQEHFNILMANSTIPKTNYLIISVKPADLDNYLLACDIGLLFREKDIINWVSRPTKMLEYQSAGLRIIHNNTIAGLTN